MDHLGEFKPGDWVQIQSVSPDWMSGGEGRVLAEPSNDPKWPICVELAFSQWGAAAFAANELKRIDGPSKAFQGVLA